MKKLEGKELYRRLQEAKNAKKLHAAAVQRNAELQKKLDDAMNLIGMMAKRMESMEMVIESQAIQLEEYKRIIFGKKKKKDKDRDDDENDDGGSGGGKPRKEREKSSY